MKLRGLFIFAILLAFTGLASADVNDSGCSGWGMMSGNYGLGFGLFGWVFSILVLIAIILLIIWLIKQIQKK